jgi:Na+-driven multidrug efflux pump
MSLNILIDTIFVGQWISPLAIAVVTVVFPITFLISSLGMAIGVGGGGSVLSRAGAKNKKSKTTFANQIMMTFLLAFFVILDFFFSRECCFFYGAKGYYGTCNNIPITRYSFSAIPCP